MQIRTSITEKEYIALNFYLFVRKPVFRILAVIIVLLLAYNLYNALTPGQKVDDSIFGMCIVYFVLFPSGIYLFSRKNYRSNLRIQEPIEYEFGQELVIKGDSFTSRLSWDKIYKVTRSNRWLLIWQTRQTANVIAMRDIWQGDLTKLKEILDAHQVKNNL